MTLSAQPIELGAKSILVYSNHAGNSEQQFVIRLGRFQPDIVLEWESLNHQGTVHFYTKAVEAAERMVVSQLFDPGVDIESPDVMSKWISRALYAELTRDGKGAIELNRSKLKLQAKGDREIEVQLNKQPVKVLCLVVEDSRDGEWLILKDENNPLVMQYQTRFYRETLERISTAETNNLRWLKKLPPVK